MRFLGYVGLVIISLFVAALAKMTLDVEFSNWNPSWRWVATFGIVGIFCAAMLGVIRWAGKYQLEGRRPDSFPYQGGSGIVPPSQNPPPPEQHD
jgi:hypothetical protein